jgi:hypothetical protein
VRFVNLEEAKNKIAEIEDDLAARPFLVFHTFERNGRWLYVCLTERLRKKAKKAHLWKSPHFLTAIKNAEYGFDERHARSGGGTDGIFLLDRTHTPANEMMRKIFDKFLDKPDSGVDEIASALRYEKEKFLAARLVSHHLRLLGVIARKKEADWLILIDFDDTK